MDHKILFALTSFLVLLNACERNAGGKSKLSIQFPEVVQTGKISALVSNGSTDDWSLVIPTGFSGNAPFNCFGVYISGPEAALRTNQCYKNQASTIPMKVFGKWKGGVLQGKTLDFEVEAGKDRVVGVFGFYAADPSACKDFTGTADMDKSQLSKPYFLGEAGQLEFIGGQTKEVAVNLTFDANQSFEECKGPDFQNGSGGGGGGSTPSYGDFGTGADGNFIVSSGMTDPRNVNSPLKAVPLITTTRVMSLNVGSSAKNLVIGTKLTGLASKFVVGDEVALYVAAGNSCGNTVVGFRTRGIVQTVASAELNINVDDERFSTITTSALAATAGGVVASRNFCRLVITRVPNFNTLTFNGSNGANIAFNAAGFGDLSNDSADHEAGIVIIRVKDKVVLTTSGGIDVATRGYNGGAYSKDGQGYDGANTDTPTTFAVNGSGGSGGLSSPSIHPGGGGHGGTGGNGLANGFGGLVVGDQYGCGYGVVDTSCLFGKVFMGGGGGGGYDAAGGSGGGLILLDAKTIELNGNSFVLNADGANSFGGSTMGGAGGAGGSVRVITQNVTGSGSAEMKLRSNGGYAKTSSGLGLGRGGSGGGGRNHLHVTGSCSVPSTAIALEAYSPSQYDNTIQGFGGGAGSNRADGAGIGTCNGIAQNITPFIARFYPTSATADITFGATVTVYGESLGSVTSAVLQNTVTPASQYNCTISNQTATKFDCLTMAPAAQYHLIVTGAGGRKTTYQAAITLN
ncbi:hypothetical protein AZI86_08550 [Bdellovibrio bacteriovorus]|uniref:Uncharacterized protein n=1 Tax=Bdellovibrio bacteriovorus TaxID=959 RepID=A0A150WRC3_BDEBC|nr:hypothetical protein [Bdellovibrio bacteriovorus]KYG67053.1 hypothetical protein AZI86_08550 [Bdellovibrio bacteriovorus]